MNTADLAPTLRLLLDELVRGAPPRDAFVLNPHDPGLLRSLDRLGAEEASASHAGGAPIAAHVDHLRYGVSLMNRWAGGDNPFSEADWEASWRISRVSDDEWATLRRELARELDQWGTVVGIPRDIRPVELAGMIGSIVHLAYHLGAIRQIDRSARGPLATEPDGIRPTEQTR